VDRDWGTRSTAAEPCAAAGDRDADAREGQRAHRRDLRAPRALPEVVQRTFGTLQPPD
jgi:hypothetical protein